MDFLKTLMLYMSLTFASTVQSAPTPEVTPVPTPAPTAVVEQAPQGDAPALLPDVSATQAPAAQKTEKPTPAMTPNKRYSNLKQGSRGDNVKKLQLKLIELGYLAEGSADGVYGGNTRKAVVKFQQVNGLGSDGVAGEKTQTWLFEHPAVLPNPDRATPTPAPTETPAPTQAPTAEPAAEATIAPPEATAAPEQLADAVIVMNDAGEPLTYLKQEDGVTMARKPRVWLKDGELLISLANLADALEDWNLQQEGNTYTLTAAGYTVVLTSADPFTCTVDGKALPLEAQDVLLTEDGLLVSPAFLAMCLNAETEWDDEESTLMIRLQHKSVTQATD